MSRYSIFTIIAKAVNGNRGWNRAWRDSPPKSNYDVLIIGGGGHGLATAYYLAKEHGVTNVAVVEKSYIGSGNAGRNGTVIRSNYMMPGNTELYEKSVQLWEGLSRDLNFNVMYSPRGQLNLLHSPAQIDAARRRGNIMRLNGIDAELLSVDETRAKAPYLDFSKQARFPIVGALWQQRAGTARHDAVVWGYARAADKLGVDIIQECEVTGFSHNSNGRVNGVETTRGSIKAFKIGMAVAGHTSTLCQLLGLPLPIESHALQACVTEPIKPLVNCVISFGAAHFYFSQSDKGGLVLGSDLDGYNSYAQRGNLPKIDHAMASAKSLMPCLSRLRVLRHWAGVVDMTPDGSPIICKTPVDGLYLNAGWNYGGFKATPASGWCFAWTIAKNEPHPINSAFTLDRFRYGNQISESGAPPQNYAQ
ncbi:MAG: sarcosine oxidase subunit beta family protein [Candidatus Tectomicrobia bacterium]